jgi:threonine synthase
MAGIVERWRDWLPLDGSEEIVSLQEGNTPLIEMNTISKIVGGGRRVFAKFEGGNPTGSFKDRGMALAMTKALSQHSPGVICASTGNTSASAAAYAAKAKLPCYVVLPAGNVAAGKLAQAVVHGARIIAIDGNFDEALALVRQAAEDRNLTLVNSVNPYRIEGQKTVAFEIAEQLGAVPEAHFIPVGNAGNITATWRGYRQWCEKYGTMPPAMYGFQAAGAAPIVQGAPVENPETVATAIRIGNPASWQEAVEAAKNSSGAIAAVTDDEILQAYHRLASHEGIFCEPASAASVAGLLQSASGGRLDVPEGATIVCTLTGHGLKDPDRAMSGVTLPEPIVPSLAALLEAM